MSGDWDQLLAEARQRLDEWAEGGELGVSVTLEEHGSFLGRFRGLGTAATKRGDVGVFLVWDEHGEKRFFWSKTMLQREFDELQPNVGDEIAIVRGDDIPNSDPDRSPTQRYAVKARPSLEPLPGESATDADIPFMPTAGPYG
jgi:hypothetical protein